MTTLKDIREKNVKTDLELCILFMADPQTASDDDIQTADDVTWKNSYSCANLSAHYAPNYKRKDKRNDN
jgi:hypothetical protein